MNKKYILDESIIPERWYNIAADLPEPPAPPLHPGTLQPAGPDDLAPIFPMGLIAQEAAGDRYIAIPDEVRDIYRIWRPTPLVRAANLEKALETPAHIYFKNEGVSPAGSHKANTAVAQAFYNKQAGVKRIATETGAGQWGSALSLACKLFGIDLTVYMVKISYQQKPYRRSMMQLWGAEVYPSPSDRTNAGRTALAEDPDSNGTLGLAISEAIEVAAQDDDCKYSLGSVLNHVLLHQTVIGEEAIAQCEAAGAYPDVIVGCVGGGSSFAGIAFPFLRERIAGTRQTRFLAVEPTACPTITKGEFTYDFGDVAQTTPLLKMHTLGHDFMPAGIHAGGLRYHGMAPLVSHVVNMGLMEAVAVPQTRCFDAAQLFACTEGIIPAPESSHAIKAVIDEALRAKEEGAERNILFNLTGHGLLDLSSYDAYLSGNLRDYDHPEEAIAAAMARLPKVS
ncbi:MAG: TrpB-like pyridoxal phosphate-dependent enzyme [Actinobacteria bacterium]|nr:TrpB-like pyridoxal phosphate-dependent enzyme [Actinomycetota bacterium]